MPPARRRRPAGGVYLQAIDRGVPTDGTLTMDGFRGVTIRLVSDGGPITAVGVPSAFTAIRGSLAHCWVSPTGDGLYTQRTPSFLQADNTSPDPLNFDSHFLGDPSHYAVDPLQPLEETSFTGLFQPGLYPRTGLPSTPAVGYGVTTPGPVFDPFLAGGAGHLGGRFEVLPAHQSQVMDLAYLVTDSLVLLRIQVTTTDSSLPQLLAANLLVPEPGGASALLAAAGLALLRRGRNRRLVN